MSLPSSTPHAADSLHPARAAGSFSLAAAQGDTREVNRMGFGAMRLTGKGIWGEPADADEARRVLRRAVDLGITLIDTADSYGPEISERLIAEALYPYPDKLVVATKGGLVRTGPNQWTPVGRPAYLRQCVEMSLRRLKLDALPLWQLHRIDPDTPAEDQFSEIAKMVDEGKIVAVGLSEVSVGEIEQAQAAGLTVATVQNQYNLGFRTHEAVVDWCEANGVGFIPWFPLDAGKLADSDALADAADALEATPSQIALAWLLKRSPVILPIPGTSSVAHLEENTAAAEIEMPDTVFASLTEAAA